MVAALAMQFSMRPVAGSQLVLASRARPPLPMGRLRALVGEPVAARFPVGDVRLVSSHPSGRGGARY